ncbi:MAG: PhoH family protein [Eubacteriaceae bacterium]|nr:PhoH family protein [Eubacteriaceae bacterium]
MTDEQTVIIPWDEEVDPADLFGTNNENITPVEEKYEVALTYNAEGIIIIGDKNNALKAQTVMEKFIKLLKEGKSLDETLINYVMDFGGGEAPSAEAFDSMVCHTYRGKPIRCKTYGQKDYINAIRKNEIVFAIGPAGTGKTYLAMAMAISAFKAGEVGRIVLVRPAVEAGESLGFLPGDLKDKVDPYLRPLYDALYDIMGQEAGERNIGKGTIEIAPLAYMRGRTLDNSFIILDEAQNTSPEQMKMFLTRLGFGSKAVITGDITQIDLPFKERSGLLTVESILKGVKGISFISLTHADVVRNPIVQRIINAYERAEK